MITNAIINLLYLNECVVVPEFGGFIRNNISAVISENGNEIYPPSTEIIFNENLRINDGLIYNYIAYSYKCSYEEAKSLTYSWIEQINSKLNSKQAVILEGLGYLKMNMVGNVDFVANNKSNFNIESYGMSALKLKPIVYQPVKVVVQPENKIIELNEVKVRDTSAIAETLKWAAVLVPFAGLAIFGTINQNRVQNYFQNYSGMFSWANVTPGKTAENIKHTVSPITVTPTQNVISPVSIISPTIKDEIVEVETTENIEEKVVEKPVMAVVTKESVVENQYFIVCGAFSKSNNALKLCNSLQAQGYKANIIDTTPSGLIMVSMQSAKTLSEARDSLQIAKNKGYSSAWIYKKK